MTNEGTVREEYRFYDKKDRNDNYIVFFRLEEPITQTCIAEKLRSPLEVCPAIFVTLRKNYYYRRGFLTPQ